MAFGRTCSRLRRDHASRAPLSTDPTRSHNPSRARARTSSAVGELGRSLKALQAELLTLRAQLDEARCREAQARRQASIDSLTRLCNRAAFVERLQSVLARGQASPSAVAVLYIDLDGFKAVNDRHGHAVGDELLRIVGERLTSCIRAGDAVARLGGDEFACLVERPRSDERIAEIARKIVDALCEPYGVGAGLLRVGASVGVASAPEDGADANALLERADAAMYRAKRRRIGYEFWSSRFASQPSQARAEASSPEVCAEAGEHGPL